MAHCTDAWVNNNGQDLSLRSVNRVNHAFLQPTLVYLMVHMKNDLHKWKVTAIPIPHPLIESCSNSFYSPFPFQCKFTVSILAHHCHIFRRYKWWHMISIPIRQWQQSLEVIETPQVTPYFPFVSLMEKCTAIPQPLLKGCNKNLFFIDSN